VCKLTSTLFICGVRVHILQYVGLTVFKAWAAVRLHCCLLHCGGASLQADPALGGDHMEYTTTARRQTRTQFYVGRLQTTSVFGLVRTILLVIVFIDGRNICVYGRGGSLNQ